MFQSPDFYEIDKLLNSEQILVRDSIREWVNENISPIIEKAFLDGKFPRHLIGSLYVLLTNCLDCQFVQPI